MTQAVASDGIIGGMFGARAQLKSQGIHFRTRGGGPTFTVEALKGGAVIATLDMREVSNKRLIRIEGVYVNDKFRRSKIGTVLYEAAAEVACKQRRQLASDITRSPFAEAFWRKQKQRGRARCLSPNRDPKPHPIYGSQIDPNVFNGPVDEFIAQAEEECERFDSSEERARCVKARVDAVLARLPKPKAFKNAQGVRFEHWPCRRWVAKRSLCREGRIDLSGLMSRSR